MSIKIPGFGKAGNWYKGNLHAHTDLFDGLASPEEVAALYRNAGYHFLAITDHNLFNVYPEFSAGNFLMIPGAELTPGIRLFDFKDEANRELLRIYRKLFAAPGSVTEEMKIKSTAFWESLFVDFPGLALDHVVAISLSENAEPWGVDGAQFHSLQSMVDFAAGKNCLAIVAHPYFSSLDTADLLNLKGIAGIEAYNHVCVPREESTVYWDVMLGKGVKTFAFACDDLHDPDWIFGGYIMVKSGQLTHKAIIEAILEGDFYASGGPEITAFEIIDDEICIQCSKARQIRFFSDNFRNRKVYSAKSGEFLTECKYRLRGNDKYIRVEVVDEDGKKAWTNPVWF